MDDPATGWITRLSEDECRARLGTTTVGLIAFVDDEDGQQLLPVNFAVLGGVIYFLTATDGVLARLATGRTDVAFAVTHADIFGVGWNVTVHGTARSVDDPKTLDLVMSYERLRPWPGGTRPLLVQIAPERIAGRRVVAG